MPQDGAPSSDPSVDVLAAQVRAELRSQHGRWALDALVARAKEAEERAEAHLLLRKEAASWAEEVELERDALVARVTEAEEREAYAWSCAEDMKGWAQRAEQKLATARQNASLSMGREVGWQHRSESAEAGLADARNALEAYANPQHWAIDRTDWQFPKCIWIGPGADQRVPNAPELAREVLARLDCQEADDDLAKGRTVSLKDELARLDGNQP